MEPFYHYQLDIKDIGEMRGASAPIIRRVWCEVALFYWALGYQAVGLSINISTCDIAVFTLVVIFDPIYLKIFMVMIQPNQNS